MSLISSPSLELWGGVECTVNRVGNHFFDQLVKSGHARRISDLDLFADLGIRAIRYPVVWERLAPDGNLENIDWTWTDERLNRLRELNIRPIVGLVHHGSGPRGTNLLDPVFPERLAEFARLVAARYPWVDAYTPVNEPLTTARFSALYGHWYPHARNEESFSRALLNQCRAVVLAMQAVREVNPAAQLIQTDDLGKTHSTPMLRYQAEFENERRWITYDLLCGKVDNKHAMHDYLRYYGWNEADFSFFQNSPCPPDVIGINHYLTSERFLDARLDRYPTIWHGGNGRHNYADVPAVRVCAEGLAGTRTLLEETWNRYGIPVAVTEAHLGCTREEQMRWLLEVWQSAAELRSTGADIRAVTAWSLLGAYDWNSLVTRDANHYEPGIFDLRGDGGVPRPTMLASILRDLSENREPQHPVLQVPGWWKRPTRFDFTPVTTNGRNACAELTRAQRQSFRQSRTGRRKMTPILITGADGTLGNALARLCEVRGLPYFLTTRSQMDIADRVQIARIVDAVKPWAIVNAAGYARIDEAEREVARCRRDNADGPANLAEICAQRSLQFLTFSSEFVFNGKAGQPYGESDATGPLGVLGSSKLEGELRVSEILPSALIVRAGAFFGPWDNANMVTQALRAFSENRTFMVPGDALVSPTYVPDLVNASLDLLIDEAHGVWHLSNGEATTWPDFLARAAAKADMRTDLIETRPLWALNLPAPRPLNGALRSERGALLPSLDDALLRYCTTCEMLNTAAHGDEAIEAAA